MLPTFQQWQDSGGITGLDGNENYIGENPADMLVLPVSRDRDSDPLEQSNFATALAALGGESDAVQVRRFNHWACGWYDLILIDPADTGQVAAAENIVSQLQNYPILDEQDYSDREQQKAANEIWRNCFDRHDRLAYIRQRRRTFEFNNFAELMACVRGECFRGDASELLA